MFREAINPPYHSAFPQEKRSEEISARMGIKSPENSPLREVVDADEMETENIPRSVSYDGRKVSLGQFY